VGRDGDGIRCLDGGLLRLSCAGTVVTKGIELGRFWLERAVRIFFFWEE